MGTRCRAIATGSVSLHRGPSVDSGVTDLPGALGGWEQHGCTHSIHPPRRGITPFVLLDLEQRFFCAATFLRTGELSAAGFLVDRLKESPGSAALNRYSQISQLSFRHWGSKRKEKKKSKRNLLLKATAPVRHPGVCSGTGSLHCHFCGWEERLNSTVIGK